MTAPPSASERVRRFAANPPVRFDTFMERALFDPQLGYYASGRARIGREGDFTTSVSVSRMFGRVLADCFADVWLRLKQPTPFTLVEQGANDAALASDILQRLSEAHPACFAATHLHFVEPFAHLREAQRAKLHGSATPVTWHASLTDLPSFTGVHFSNEYVDALPVRLFQFQNAVWHERFVDLDPDGHLRFVNLPAPADVLPDLPQNPTADTLAELRPAASTWLSELAPKLAAGLILIIDYGFARDDLQASWRTTGTLSCYRGHRRDDDPLTDPGDKDITAHVNFTDLALAAQAAGLTTAGFADQYHFLTGAALPLLRELESLPDSPTRTRDLQGLKSLLHPEVMGTQFKYLGLSRHLPLPLPAYQFARAGDLVSKV